MPKFIAKVHIGVVVGEGETSEEAVKDCLTKVTGVFHLQVTAESNPTQKLSQNPAPSSVLDVPIRHRGYGYGPGVSPSRELDGLNIDYTKPLPAWVRRAYGDDGFDED